MTDHGSLEEGWLEEGTLGEGSLSEGSLGEGSLDPPRSGADGSRPRTIGPDRASGTDRRAGTDRPARRGRDRGRGRGHRVRFYAPLPELGSLEEALRWIAELGEVDGVIADGGTGAFLACTRSAHERLGYTREEFLRLTPLDLQAGAEHDADWVRRQLEVMQETPRGRFFTSHRRKSGQIREVEVRYQLASFGGRRLILLTILDHTEQSNREQALQRMNDLLGEAERLSHIGSWERNHARGTLLWSKEIHRICETDEASFHPRWPDYLALIHPEDREAWEAAFQRSLDSGDPLHSQHRLLLPSGTLKVVLVRCRTLYDRSGEPSYTLGTVQDITESQSFQKQLEEAAYVDPVTGLPNKSAARRHLEQLLQGRSYNASLALIDLDLDGFQTINDNFGAQAGDRILRFTAQTLREQIRPGDWLARLGSDEFLVILGDPITSVGDAIVHARRLQSRLAAQVAPEADLPLTLSACLGVSCYPEHGGNVDDLLQGANTALMEAKRDGPNQLRGYSTAISRRIRERMELDCQLALAIPHGQLRLVFQPQVDREGRMVGAEALLRWTNAQGQAVSPSLFIPVAEQSGLVVDLGHWVLQEACRHIREWRDEGLAVPRVAVNISARQLDLADPPLSRRFLAILRAHGLEPGAIELEITETALLQHPKRARDQLSRLASEGFSIAIDDFGTGYSSLDSLHSLPLHKLKIDRCFIGRLGEEGADRAIVRATISMARDLGLLTLAEGVETEEQRRILTELHCDFFQGYLCSRPLEADAFRARLLAPPCDGAGTASPAQGHDRPRSSAAERPAGVACGAPQPSRLDALRQLRCSLDAVMDACLVLEEGPEAAAEGAPPGFLIREANRAACEALGSDRDSLLDTGFVGLLRGAVHGEVARHFAASLRSGETLELEHLELDDPSGPGSPRTVDLRIVPEPGWLTVAWRDVTDPMRSLRTLAETVAHYRQLMETIHEVIVMVGPDGRLRWLSPSLTRMTGWLPYEWEGRDFGEIFHTPMGQPLPIALADWLQERRERHEGRLRIRDRDGRWCWVDAHLRRLKAPEGSQGWVLTIHTVDEQVHSEERLRKRASTDSLTGLLNRTAILDWLQHRLADPSRRPAQLALLFCDLDHFKDVNDRHGHQAGDALLVATADRLTAQVRQSDRVARLGGDELLVVLDGVGDPAMALQVAEKLRRAVATPVPCEGETLQPSLSIGVTLDHGDESLDQLIRRADQAMYAAKDQGRNRVVLVDPPAPTALTPGEIPD